MKTKLQELFEDQRQSPWLDNLTRGHLTTAELERLVEGGIRGVISNPTIFAKAPVPEDFSRLLADKIEGARYEVLRDTNHFAHVENSEEFAKLVKSFIREELAEN